MVVAMQFRRKLAALTIFLSCLGTAAAQVMSDRTVDGKQVACMHSGLMSDLSDCGAKSWYAYVFVGSISRIKPTQKDEFEIQIVPEEIFSGKPDNPVTVLTSQGLCLPKMAVGDRWLFYLRKETGKPIFLDYYGNDSRPAANAQSQIATLRRFQLIGDFAILRGEVVHGASFVGTPLPNARVTAHSTSDNAQFVSTTDADGRYEFQPLTPGNYKITVDPIGSYQPDDSAIELKPGTCRDLTLSRSPHAEIGGYVRHADGSPVTSVDLVLIRSDNSWYLTTQTDRNGHFKFVSQVPGEYVLGVNFPKRPDWFDGSGAGKSLKLPPASLFYPGVAKLSDARVIRLKAEEHLDNLDFTLPAQ
jgi:hypothetical protein